MGLNYTVHPINIGKGEQFAPLNFSRYLPTTRFQPSSIPTMEFRVSKSGVILIYLADKVGRFYPQDFATAHQGQ